MKEEYIEFYKLYKYPDIVDGFDEEAEAQKQWKLLKVLGDSELENALYLDDEGLETLCPYCKQEVDFIEDIEVPADAVGQKKDGRYITQVFRKCPHCGNIVCIFINSIKNLLFLNISNRYIVTYK